MLKYSTRTAQERDSYSVIKTNQLVLYYKEIIVLRSEIHIEHIYALCGKKVDLVNPKHGGI
jgi:hypothetical protein